MVLGVWVPWALFILIFGGYGAYKAIEWWMKGGFKIYLKYKHDVEKEKIKFAKDIKKSKEEEE